MRITRRQLTQIIREELLREVATEAEAVKMAAASGNAADGPVHQVDREGKEVADGSPASGGLSFQLTVQGLTDEELKAMKKEYSKYVGIVAGDSKFFLSLENISGQSVSFYMQNLDAVEDGGLPEAATERYESGTGSKGFYPLSTNEMEGPELDVELGASTDDLLATVFWGANPYVLKLGEIATQAKALVTGADPYPAALIKFVVGAGKDIIKSVETDAPATKISLALPAGITAADVKKWQADVTKAPLRRGSQGPNVKIAQELLKAFFDGGIVKSIDLRGEGSVSAAARNAFVKAGLSLESDQLMLSALSDKMKPDSNMGPITSAAVFAFQIAVNSEGADGVIGKDTAASLVDMFNMTAVTSESIVRRWNKLAGLLVD